VKPYNGDPVDLYLDGKTVRVHQIDAPAWREQGWGEDPETKTPVVEPVEPPVGGEGGESTDTTAGEAPAGDEGGEPVEPPASEPKPVKKGK
jgi:hypothetical protein